jgi:hypothetical protein
MSSYSRATVLSVKRWGPGICSAELEMERGGSCPGIVLEQLVGKVCPGDLVIANTTAVDLSLGSGGSHYVLWNLSRRSLDTGGTGHIMKLRYTPLQFNVEAAEERLGDAGSLDMGRALGGVPVIAGSVHSQLLPVALAYRHVRPKARLVYVMTDGGALPGAFSNTVRFLKDGGYLAADITCGHAFGGDYEAVNVHGALVAARQLLEADAVVVVMGPGIVGTGSAVGFSGMEQGIVVNAAASLGGAPIAIPRLSFADERVRHKGLSHHTVSALKYGACVRTVVPIPVMEEKKAAIVDAQINEFGLSSVHDFRTVDAGEVLRLLAECSLKASVMGRGVDRDPEYFLAAGAAGFLAAECRGGA